MFFREFNFVNCTIVKKYHHRFQLLIIFFVIVAISGCTYSRWDYKSVGEHPENEFWSIRFGLPDIGAFIPISKGRNDADTAYDYIVNLIEADTTQYPRLKFIVENVQVTYSSLSEPILLQYVEEDSRGGEHIGATNVVNRIFFTSFRVPVPRPDTIYVDQDITIYYRETGEELKKFHYQTKARLKRYRRTYIADIIEGT